MAALLGPLVSGSEETRSTRGRLTVISRLSRKSGDLEWAVHAASRPPFRVISREMTDWFCPNPVAIDRSIDPTTLADPAKNLVPFLDRQCLTTNSSLSASHEIISCDALTV